MMCVIQCHSKTQGDHIPTASAFVACKALPAAMLAAALLMGTGTLFTVLPTHIFCFAQPYSAVLCSQALVQSQALIQVKLRQATQAW